MLTAPEARAIDDADVSGSSVAEATARAACLLSFIRSLYEKHPVVVTKDEVAIPVGIYGRKNKCEYIRISLFKDRATASKFVIISEVFIFAS